MELRLNILYQANIINSYIYHGMNQVINRLEQFWCLPVHTAQGDIIITHMANALMRTYRGECINTIASELFLELNKISIIDYIKEINQDLLTYFDLIPEENETAYLLLNLYGLYLATNSPSDDP